MRECRFMGAFANFFKNKTVIISI